MNPLPTLRRELLTAFALVFTGAMLVASAGVLLVLPRIAEPRHAALFLPGLLLVVLLIFVLYGRHVLHKCVLRPLERMVAGVESIAAGDYSGGLPESDTEEMARLAAAVSQMKDRLVADRHELAANVRSLDETNRMLTEARDVMIRAEKLTTVGRLSAGIAHEIGNPLAAIVGYLGLIARATEGQTRDLVDAATRETQRIDRIVHGLLDYSRPREPRAEQLDVNAVIRETVDLVRTQGRFADIVVETDLDATVPAVHGDPYQLQQVFVNLFINASDALGPAAGGQLSITTRHRAVRAAEHLPIRRRSDPEGIDYSHRRRLAAAARLPHGDPVADSGRIVEIVVQDNGPGIPPDILPHVFDPFVTTREPGKGTGLGLAVSTRLIETMEGRIRVENSPAGGAVFTILLPAVGNEMASAI